jgi:hypothetical protein
VQKANRLTVPGTGRLKTKRYDQEDSQFSVAAPVRAWILSQRPHGRGHDIVKRYRHRGAATSRELNPSEIK